MGRSHAGHIVPVAAESAATDLEDKTGFTSFVTVSLD
jgi:hypothetical protein